MDQNDEDLLEQIRFDAEFETEVSTDAAELIRQLRDRPAILPAVGAACDVLKAIVQSPDGRATLVRRLRETDDPALTRVAETMKRLFAEIKAVSPADLCGPQH